MNPEKTERKEEEKENELYKYIYTRCSTNEEWLLRKATAVGKKGYC